MGQIIKSKKAGQFVRGTAAFLGTYGISYLGSLAGFLHASFSVICIPVFIVLLGMMVRTEKILLECENADRRRKRVWYAGVVSYIFAVTMITGYQLQTYGITDGGVKGKSLILLRAVCLGIAIFPFGNMFFSWIEKTGSIKIVFTDKKWKSGNVFGISAALVFLCLIPVWLAYYPVIMSYDFHRQVNEAAMDFYWPYQPVVHTWIIGRFFRLGEWLGNLEAGMAGMALLHMLTYSLVTAYACTMLYRIVKRKWVVPAGILFFGIFPLNSVLVVCTTKDVLFSVLFLLFILLMVERFFFAQGKKKYVTDVFLILEGCIMTQFRNNCIYAIVAFGILWLLFAAKKEKLRVLVFCVLLVAGSKGTSAIINTALGVQLGGARGEMFSVPIMQFARVGYYHENELDEEMWQTLNNYLPAEKWEEYYPPISDAMKASASYMFSEEGHMMELLGNWSKFAVRFPNEFIDAFLELTRGYWFWDDRSNVECLGIGIEGRMGSIYTYTSSALNQGGEIVHESKFPWLEEQLEKIVSANSYYNWPVVSIIFRTAFYFWGLIIAFMSYIYLRRKKPAIICLFPLMYMATLLLGPIVQIRYIFPIMLTLPVLIGLLVLPEDETYITVK